MIIIIIINITSISLNRSRSHDTRRTQALVSVRATETQTCRSRFGACVLCVLYIAVRVCGASPLKHVQSDRVHGRGVGQALLRHPLQLRRHRHHPVEHWLPPSPPSPPPFAVRSIAVVMAHVACVVCVCRVRLVCVVWHGVQGASNRVTDSTMTRAA